MCKDGLRRRSIYSNPKVSSFRIKKTRCYNFTNSSADLDKRLMCGRNSSPDTLSNNKVSVKVRLILVFSLESGAKKSCTWPSGWTMEFWPDRLETIDHFLIELGHDLQIRIYPPERFVGVTIIRDRQNRQIHLSQADYINQVVRNFQMESCPQFERSVVEKIYFWNSKMHSLDGILKLILVFKLYHSKFRGDFGPRNH
jgi:hypothetical protein